MTAVTHTRVTARIDPATQSLLNRAAEAAGIPTINAFVLGAAVEKAKAILQQEEIIRLNADSSLRLLDALENPPAPNRHLSELFREHRSECP